MRKEIVLIIVLMALVTYIPRVLPSFIVGKLRLGKKTEKFLRLIPYTAMTALVFPGIFTSVNGNVIYGIAGGAVAAFLAYMRCPVVICVIMAVITDVALMNLVG